MAVFNKDKTKLVKMGVNMNWVVLATRQPDAEYWIPKMASPAEMPKLLHSAKKSEYEYDDVGNVLVKKAAIAA